MNTTPSAAPLARLSTAEGDANPHTALTYCTLSTSAHRTYGETAATSSPTDGGFGDEANGFIIS